jgi:hypothetical protein
VGRLESHPEKILETLKIKITDKETCLCCYQLINGDFSYRV